MTTPPYYDPNAGRRPQPPQQYMGPYHPDQQQQQPRGYNDPNQSGGARGWILQQLLDFINPFGYLAKKQRRNQRAQQRQAPQPRRRRWF